MSDEQGRALVDLRGCAKAGAIAGPDPVDRLVIAAADAVTWLLIAREVLPDQRLKDEVRASARELIESMLAVQLTSSRETPR